MKWSFVQFFFSRESFEKKMDEKVNIAPVCVVRYWFIKLLCGGFSVLWARVLLLIKRDQ